MKLLKNWWLLASTIPLLSFGQQMSEGIRFETGMTWAQITAKAQQEHKYIFVDCAASWCAPCKRMENEVFQRKNVGNFVNQHFISIHMQLDTSNSDDPAVKSAYAEAAHIKKICNVNAFPTYLFFDSNGKLVHRYLNAMSDSLFLIVAANALDPGKQYYTLLSNYRAGERNAKQMRYLAMVAKTIGEEKTAIEIAVPYLHNYQNQMSESELLEKRQLEFYSTFNGILTSQDKPFKVLYKSGKRADAIMRQKDFAKNIVYSVIVREEINPRIWPRKKPISATPDWAKLKTEIGYKYNNDYTDLVVLDAQLKWYHQKKDHSKEIKYTVEKIEKYGIDTAGVGWAMFNNMAYDLFFKHCDNKDTLNKVISWLGAINKDHPDDYPNMDTYANLLYKVGRNAEAINLEDRAAQLDAEEAKKQKRDPDPSFRETLDKMKAGKPTWPEKH